MLEFYGISYPTENDRICDVAGSPVLVTECRKEALDICKKVKGSRFKTFSTREEALQFCLQGQEVVDGASVGQAVVAEKPLPFRGPSPQDIVKLRKSSEAGDVEYFLQSVWSNPRYLISSGDTPVTSGGQKYNILHFICKANQHKVGQALLKTISDIEFLKLYYQDDEESSLVEKRDRLLDYYLNTPDKTSQETPLHVASKFGAVDCVELLCSYVETDTKKLNKDGESALDVVCKRTDRPNEIKEKMRKLLSGRYYIPVLVSDDITEQHVVGDLWSPDVTVDERASANSTFQDTVFGTPTRGVLPARNTRVRTPSRITGPTSPFGPNSPKVVGYAGPTDRETAENIQKRWKTPPRVVLTPGAISRLDITATPPRRINSNQGSDAPSSGDVFLPSPMRHDQVRHFNTPFRASNRGRTASSFATTDEPDSSIARMRAVSEIRLKDPERGLHDFGMELCLEKGVPFVEYWSFLNDYVNLRSEKGLEKLDSHLKRKSAELKRQKLDTKQLIEKLGFLAISRENSQKKVEDLSSSPVVKIARSRVDHGCAKLDENYNAKSPVSDICDRLQRLSLATPSPAEDRILAFDSESKSESDWTTSFVNDNGSVRSIPSSLPQSEGKLNLFKEKFFDLLERISESDNDDETVLFLRDFATAVKDLKADTTDGLGDLVENFLAQLLSNSRVCDKKDVIKTRVRQFLDTPSEDLETKYGASVVYSAKFLLDLLDGSYKRGEILETPEGKTGDVGLLRYHLANGNASRSFARRLFQQELHESEDNDDGDDDVFDTPETSPNSAVTPEEEEGVFIEGREPSKVDHDVLRAIKGVSVDSKKFPYVFIWQHCINEASSKDQVREPLKMNHDVLRAIEGVSVGSKDISGLFKTFWAFLDFVVTEILRNGLE